MFVYSIIIPHKNVPNLLERLLASIPQREDTEIIIVDDHSDSEKVDFESFPGKNRPFTKCIFLDESKGAGYARNKGIEVAQGKWLLFADSDDFYTENLSLLLDRFSDNENTDIVYLNAQSYFEKDGHTEEQYYGRYFKRYKSNKLYAEKVIRFNIFTPWSRMVKADLVREYNIRYEEIPVGNDKMFCLQCSKYAKTIDIENKVIYNYFRQSEGSLTYSYSRRLEGIKSRLSLQSRANQLYEEVGYTFLQSYIYGYMRSSLKSRELREIYKSFMRENHISVSKDIYNMVKLVIGKLMKVL